MILITACYCLLRFSKKNTTLSATANARDQKRMVYGAIVGSKRKISMPLAPEYKAMLDQLAAGDSAPSINELPVDEEELFTERCAP